ncbi:hypothetical protein VUR80DRAFT_948 [Thermomyces stellatus]
MSKQIQTDKMRRRACSWNLPEEPCRWVAARGFLEVGVGRSSLASLLSPPDRAVESSLVACARTRKEETTAREMTLTHKTGSGRIAHENSTRTRRKLRKGTVFRLSALPPSWLRTKHSAATLDGPHQTSDPTEMQRWVSLPLGPWLLRRLGFRERAILPPSLQLARAGPYLLPSHMCESIRYLIDWAPSWRSDQVVEGFPWRKLYRKGSVARCILHTRCAWQRASSFFPVDHHAIQTSPVGCAQALGFESLSEAK